MSCEARAVQKFFFREHGHRLAKTRLAGEACYIDRSELHGFRVECSFPPVGSSDARGFSYRFKRLRAGTDRREVKEKPDSGASPARHGRWQALLDQRPHIGWPVRLIDHENLSLLVVSHFMKSQ
jgi:hypothetical protein